MSGIALTFPASLLQSHFVSIDPGTHNHTMAKPSSPNLRAHLLHKGIALAEDRPEIRQDLVSIFASLESFQKQVQDCKSKREALRKLQVFLEGMDFFHATAFSIVNDDFEFELELCSDNRIHKDLEHLISELIRSGQFAWALQQNHPIYVNSPETLPGETIILHGMSTVNTTLGMFIGFYKEQAASIKTTLTHLLSIMIDATVFVLENQQLQSNLRKHNQILEDTVESRTKELREVNQFLHQGNKELKRLNEKKSEFMGIAAHDLKNPLSAIIGLSQIVEFTLEALASDHPEVEKSLTFLKEIEGSADHMVHIINDLLNAETLNSGNIRLNLVPTELGNIAKKVISINHIRASEKSIEINYEEQKDVEVMIDTVRMHEAMDNLVSNAIKYSPFGSRIRIRVKRVLDENRVLRAQFSVKDEGPGLTEDDKSRLFGRFEKLSARPTGGESSTGLGLSIVKSIVELHKGNIWAESVHGHGSTFSFNLPLLDKEK